MKAYLDAHFGLMHFRRKDTPRLQTLLRAGAEIVV